MNPTAIVVLRWLAVLPAALLGYILGQVVPAFGELFLAKWIVQINQSLFSAAVCVAVSMAVAPQGKVWVGGVFMALQVIANGAMAVLAWTGLQTEYSPLWLTFCCLVGIGGAVMGFMIGLNEAEEAKKRAMA